MAPIPQLAGIGVIASGFGRILVAYALFVVLTRLTSRPRLRHVFWLLFVIGAAFYWATLLVQVLEPQLFAGIATRLIIAGAPGRSSNTLAQLTIPYAWEHRLELAGMALVCTYVGGLIFMLIRLARRRRSLRQAVAKARSVSPDIDCIFQSQCHRLGVSRSRILELPGLSSPGAAYTWKPVVLIPEDLRSYLDEEQFIDVLYHELIHVRRLDFCWNTMADFVGCLLFFHPAVWLALRNLRRERELACDEVVMELRHGRRTEYASCLTRLARRRVLGQQLDPQSHLALLSSFLAFRVQTLLAGNHRCSRAKQSASITAGLGALLAFSAGWPFLSLAIELAPPSAVNNSPVERPGRSAAFRKVPARRAKSDGPSTEIGLPLSNPPAPNPALTEPDAASNLTLSDDGGNDVEVAAKQVEAVRPRPDVGGQSVWDESPLSIPTNASPSLHSTVLSAAIGALQHVALGRRTDDDDGRK